MQHRHRARADAAGEAVAHHQVVALAQLGQEARDVREVIAVVRIGHEHIGAAGGGDARVQRGTVAANRYGDEASTAVCRDLL